VQPDAVFAHGLATTDSDLEETAALRSVLGASADRIPAPAIKSMLGNSMAASGALEAIAALLAIAHNCLPPTINLTAADPRCDLDYVAGSVGRPMPLDAVALVNANLGGGHGALVVRRVA
jgi:3-oxoacyl-(acyl-carrier-protein) synthase